MIMCCEKCSKTIDIVKSEYDKVLTHVFKKHLGGIGAICRKCSKALVNSVYTIEKGRKINLQDMICETPRGCKVIFKNGDALNCRNENLIICLIG